LKCSFPIVGKIWTTTTQELADRVLKDSETFTIRRDDGRIAGLRPLVANPRIASLQCTLRDDPGEETAGAPPQKKSAPERAQSAEVERCKLLANSAGLNRRCEDRLARLDHGAPALAEELRDFRRIVTEAGRATSTYSTQTDGRHLTE
jgi:hypothetical protein